jgi:hypothetical protein
VTQTAKIVARILRRRKEGMEPEDARGENEFGY